jgi:ribosomal protein L32
MRHNGYHQFMRNDRACPNCGNWIVEMVGITEGSVLKGALLDATFILRPLSKYYNRPHAKCSYCGKVMRWLPRANEI